MANKYVTSPCNPRNMCVGEEAKYVVKEGAKGTTPHTTTNNETTLSECLFFFRLTLSILLMDPPVVQAIR